MTVRVNPADIETMREHREQLMSMNDIDNMRVIEDQRVDRGGVVIETEAGTIDAKISTQLREARRAARGRGRRERRAAAGAPICSSRRRKRVKRGRRRARIFGRSRISACSSPPIWSGRTAKSAKSSAW